MMSRKTLEDARGLASIGDGKACKYVDEICSYVEELERVMRQVHKVCLSVPTHEMSKNDFTKWQEANRAVALTLDGMIDSGWLAPVSGGWTRKVDLLKGEDHRLVAVVQNQGRWMSWTVHYGTYLVAAGEASDTTFAKSFADQAIETSVHLRKTHER